MFKGLVLLTHPESNGFCLQLNFFFFKIKLGKPCMLALYLLIQSKTDVYNVNKVDRRIFVIGLQDLFVSVYFLETHLSLTTLKQMNVFVSRDYI